MKIAVASTDGVSISQHFGRSQCFVVFDITDDGAIGDAEVRANSHTAHAQGQCLDGQHSHDQPHSHVRIVNALADCQAVLCGGMGWRAAEELQANGIRPAAVDPALTPRQAVLDYLAGRCDSNRPWCRCHE